jgi:hypothetical protein
LGGVVGIVIGCDTVAKLTIIVNLVDIKHMTKFKFSAFVMSFFAFMPSFAMAQFPNSANGSFTASATVVQPLTVSAGPLSFGSFAAGNLGGTVTVSTGSPSTRTSTGDVMLSRSGNGNASTVTVYGAPGMKYGITLPNAGVKLYVGGITSGPSMTISEFTTNLSSSGAVASSSVETFQIGATLQVSANQPIGAYSAPVLITVTYE